jgi:hypothetical protein
MRLVRLVKYSYGKFKKKFDKFFQKKSRLLGEVYLSENEYRALLDIVRNNLLTRISNKSFNNPDIVVSVAMVQIGIRDYTEGNYWDRFCETLKINLNAMQRRDIGQLFFETLDKYGLFKYTNSETNRNDYVINILIHGIIPNYYINDFFEFVYTFYDININRNITPSLSSDLKYLTEFIADSLTSEKEEVSLKISGYTSIYRLRKSTKLYIGLLERKARFLIRRIIKLIDSKYWGGSLPKNPRNRITLQFLVWANTSERFLTDVQIAASGKKRDNKQFTSPYFTFDFEKHVINLVIPSQKFKNNEFKDEVKVKIKVNDNIIYQTNLDTYSIIGGYKTVKKSIQVPTKNMFDKIVVTVITGVSRKFNIPERSYILFDELGQNTNIHSGTIYILSKPNIIVDSDDLIEKKEFNNFSFYYLELEYNSIIFIDNTPLSPSGKVYEGLQKKGLITGIAAISEENEILPVYKSHPDILFKINNKKNIDGIGIVINGKRHRLSDIANKVCFKQFELKDGNGGWAIQINLLSLIGIKPSLVEFSIDIPGTNGIRRIGKYILMPGLKYEFIDAPYVFTDKAVIEVENEINIKAINMDKLDKGHVYGLSLTTEKTYALFSINIFNKEYRLQIEVPYLRWKFDDEVWKINSEENLWYKDIGDNLFVDFPGAGNLSLIINNDPETQQDGEYINGLYKFNFRRYLSYFSENGLKYSVNLKYNDEIVEIMTILSKCIAKSANLSFDPINKILNGNFEILGKGKCVVDIIYKDTKEKIAENINLSNSNGKLNLKGNFKNGLHTVVIYSIEEDEYGFGIYKRKIYKKDIDTTNPYDLSDKVIKLKWLRIRIFKEKLNKEYLIGNIKNGKHIGVYYGNIYVMENGVKKLWHEVSSVKITFLDKKFFNRVNLKVKYDDEWTVLLYDTFKKVLVLEEDYSLPKKIAYRRYEFLSDEETEFTVEIIKGENKSGF